MGLWHQTREDGSMDGLKVRLVARGFTQISGIDLMKPTTLLFAVLSFGLSLLFLLH